MFNASQQSLILGHPWLILHNPHTDWDTGQITSWSKMCGKNCFPNSSLSPFEPLPVDPAGSDPEFPDLSQVPTCYHELKEDFSKTRATSLPSLRPCNCTIDLLPGTSPPSERLYSLSGPETLAMTKYMEESLHRLPRTQCHHHPHQVPRSSHFCSF